MQRYSYTWIISRWYSITKTFHIIFVMLWFICIYSHFSTSLQNFQTVIDPVHFRFHFQSVPAPGLLRWRVASRPPSCCPACPSSSLRSRGPPHTHTHTHTNTDAQSCTRISKHPQTHARAHIHTHTRANTHTHPHTQPDPSWPVYNVTKHPKVKADEWIGVWQMEGVVGFVCGGR